MRVVKSIRGRDFAVSLPQSALASIQHGSLRTTYKGRRFCKNPFDVCLYLRLLERLRPRTIIEIGTSEGGSAIWFRDQCAALGLQCSIFTYDISPPKNFNENNIQSGKIDAFAPDRYLDKTFVRDLPRPLLLIEDSAHTYSSTLSVLRYFDQFLLGGDYVVVEDGVVADLGGERYEKYEDGPNRAIHDFLGETGGRYEIDEDLCDFYGHNVTYCPNAWLRVNAPIDT